MTDPNAIYKARFRELTELLGRAPVSSDPGWLAMHDEYKSGWLPAEETVLAPRARETQSWSTDHGAGVGTVERKSNSQSQTAYGSTPMTEVSRMEATGPIGANANPQNNSAAGTLEQGFSRKPAPQASEIDQECAREAVSEPLSGPGIIRNGEVAVTELEPPSSNCGAAEGPQRGPGGGLLATCEACGRLWERPARRGRPAAKCEECR